MKAKKAARLPELARKAVRKLLLSNSEMDSLVLGTLKKSIQHRRWIKPGNRYRLDTIARLDTDRASPNSPALAEYIVASAPTHLVDGFSYLGRALGALSRGDAEVAVHLGYYAELRAAMSLLASEGMGVFQTKHFLVTGSRGCTQIGKPESTHQFVWKCLHEWSLGRSADLVGTLITPQGITLDSWLDHCGFGSMKAALGQRWVKDWAFDLRTLSEDREQRNIASYRPTLLLNTPPPTADETTSFLCDFWTLFEPSLGSSLVDVHLLRQSLERAFVARRGSGAMDPVLFREVIVRGLGRAGLDVASERRLIAFLAREDSPTDPQPLVFARETRIPSNRHKHFQVVSRAALLLHIAARAVTHRLRSADIRSEDLGFWWSRFGAERALWNATTPPSAPADLWVDIREAVDATQAWRSEAGSKDLADWHRKAPSAGSFSAGELLALCHLAA